MDQGYDDLFEGKPDLRSIEDQPQGHSESNETPQVATTNKDTNDSTGNNEQFLQFLMTAPVFRNNMNDAENPFISTDNIHAPRPSPCLPIPTTQHRSLDVLRSPGMTTKQDPFHDLLKKWSSSGRAQNQVLHGVEELSHIRQTSPISPTPLARHPNVSNMPVADAAHHPGHISSFTDILSLYQDQGLETDSGSPDLDCPSNLNGVYSPVTYSEVHSSIASPFLSPRNPDDYQAVPELHNCNSDVYPAIPPSYSMSGTLDVAAPVEGSQQGSTPRPPATTVHNSTVFTLDPTTKALLAHLPKLGITRGMVENKCRAIKFDLFAHNTARMKFDQEYFPAMNDQLFKLRRVIFDNVPGIKPSDGQAMIAAVELELYRRCYVELQAIVPRPLILQNDNAVKCPAQWHQKNFLIRALIFVDSTIRKTPENDMPIWHACCWLEAMQWQAEIHDLWIHAISEHGTQKGLERGDLVNAIYEPQQSTSQVPTMPIMPLTRRPGRPPGSLNRTTLVRNAVKTQKKQQTQFPQPHAAIPSFYQQPYPPSQLPLPAFSPEIMPSLPRLQPQFAVMQTYGGDATNETQNDANQGYQSFETLQPNLQDLHDFTFDLS